MFLGCWCHEFPKDTHAVGLGGGPHCILPSTALKCPTWGMCTGESPGCPLSSHPLLHRGVGFPAGDARAQVQYEVAGEGVLLALTHTETLESKRRQAATLSPPREDSLLHWHFCALRGREAGASVTHCVSLCQNAGPQPSSPQSGRPTLILPHLFLQLSFRLCRVVASLCTPPLSPIRERAPCTRVVSEPHFPTPRPQGAPGLPCKASAMQT